MSSARARLGIAAAILLGACGGRESGGPPPATVEVYTVEPRPIRDFADLVGQLESENSVLVRPEIAGMIAAIEFAEGESVTQGEVLVRLRDEEQRAVLHEAEARNQLAAEVLRRTQKLAKSNVTAAAELDRARAEFEVSQAAVEIARVNLSRTEIRAPFDGVTGARQVAPGERVDTETTLVQIDKVDRLQLVSAIPEIGVGALRVGLPVEATVSPLAGSVFKGEVFFVAPALDPRSRQLSFKAWIPNPELRLKPGLYANVRIQVGERAQALLVPESSIVYDQSGVYVWRVTESSSAEQVPVQLGARFEGEVEITQGLHAGDRVVSAGTHKVFSGIKLKMKASHPEADTEPGDST